MLIRLTALVLIIGRASTSFAGPVLPTAKPTGAPTVGAAVTPASIVALNNVLGQVEILGSTPGSDGTPGTPEVVTALTLLARLDGDTGRAASTLLEILLTPSVNLGATTSALRASGLEGALPAADAVERFMEKHAEDRVRVSQLAWAQALVALGSPVFPSGAAVEPYLHENSRALLASGRRGHLNANLGLFEGVLRDSPREAISLAGRLNADPAMQKNGTASFVMRRLEELHRAGSVETRSLVDSVLTGFRDGVDWGWEREAMILLGTLAGRIPDSRMGAVEKILKARAPVGSIGRPMDISRSEAAKGALRRLGLEIPPEPAATPAPAKVNHEESTPPPATIADRMADSGIGPIRPTERGWRLLWRRPTEVAARFSRLSMFAVSPLIMLAGFPLIVTFMAVGLIGSTAFVYSTVLTSARNADILTLNAAADAEAARTGKPVDAHSEEVARALRANPEQRLRSLVAPVAMTGGMAALLLVEYLGYLMVDASPTIQLLGLAALIALLPSYLARQHIAIIQLLNLLRRP